MTKTDALTKPAHNRLTVRVSPRRLRWYEYSHTATGLAYWLRFLIGEPREFLYVVPQRLSCRALGRHNVTCRGRRDHPRTVTVRLDNSTGTFTPRRR